MSDNTIMVLELQELPAYQRDRVRDRWTSRLAHYEKMARESEGPARERFEKFVEAYKETLALLDDVEGLDEQPGQ